MTTPVILVDEVIDFLNEKVSQYNQPEFIETDPIQIPHHFSKKEDIEIIIIGSVYLVGDILNHVIFRDNLDLWKELRVHR